MLQLRVRLRSFIASMLATAQLACLTPRQAADPKDYITTAGLGHVRVTQTDGTVLEVYSPRILMDTLLTGWTEKGTKFVGIPLSQLQSVTTREPSTVRTTLLLGVAASAAVIAIIVFAGSNVSVVDTVEEDFTHQPRP